MAYSNNAFKQIAKPMPKPKTDNKKTKPLHKKMTNKQTLENILFA